MPNLNFFTLRYLHTFSVPFRCSRVHFRSPTYTIMAASSSSGFSIFGNAAADPGDLGWPACDDSKFPGWPVGREGAINIGGAPAATDASVYGDLGWSAKDRFRTLFADPRIPEDGVRPAQKSTIVDSPTDGHTIPCPEEIETEVEFLVWVYKVLNALGCSYGLEKFGGRWQVIATCYKGGNRLKCVLRMYFDQSGRLVLGYHCQYGIHESAYQLYNELEHYITNGLDTKIPVPRCCMFSASVPTPTPSTAPQSASDQKPLNEAALARFLYPMYPGDRRMAASLLWDVAGTGAFLSFLELVTAISTDGSGFGCDEDDDEKSDVRVLIIGVLARVLADAERKRLLPKCGTKSTKEQFSQELVDNVVDSTVSVLFPMMLKGIIEYKEHVEYARAMIRYAKTTMTVLDAMNVPGVDELRVEMNAAFEVASECCFLRSTIGNEPK
jgi:hypothetical protein